MRTVEFRRLWDDDNALRPKFEVERGHILRFMVQLESRFKVNDAWVPVVRYDTAHGFAHCDKLHPYEAATKIKMETYDYNDALTTAMDDLIKNWNTYRRRYAQWLKQK